MKYMNEYDLQRSRVLFTSTSKPNRLAAALVIDRLRGWTDSVSDGWAYWSKPCKAASRLMDLCYPQTNADEDAMVRTDATDEELAAALRPVKALLTRYSKVPHGLHPDRMMATAADREWILRVD
jgi:hypothetical protein